MTRPFVSQDTLDRLRGIGADEDSIEFASRYLLPDPRDGDPLRAPDAEPLPVAGHQGCARWWLLWLAVGAAFWAIVIALILANRAAPRSESQPVEAPVPPSQQVAPATVGALSGAPPLASISGPGVTPDPSGAPTHGASLTPPSLPAVAARPQPSRARESAPVTTPTAVVHRGVASHMGDSPDAGPRYLALPIGPGHRVRLCGAIRCLTLTSTDAGPALFMQRRGRVADLSVELFEMLTGRPASRGLAPVSWKGME